MAETKIRKTREEVLQEIKSAHDKQFAQAATLLENIKKHRQEIELMLSGFHSYEPEFVYRFYHQSFKVFNGLELIKSATNLFGNLAPDLKPLNPWYTQIVNKAISKKFDFATTNGIWLEETQSILEAFWHSRYFLEQMIWAADELEAAPQILPSGWAAVLYLYNLR